MKRKYYKLVSENGNVILISLVDSGSLENIKKNAKSCEEITKEEFESEGECSMSGRKSKCFYNEGGICKLPKGRVYHFSPNDDDYEERLELCACVILMEDEQ